MKWQMDPQRKGSAPPVMTLGEEPELISGELGLHGLLRHWGLGRFARTRRTTDDPTTGGDVAVLREPRAAAAEGGLSLAELSALLEEQRDAATRKAGGTSTGAFPYNP